MVFKKRSAPPRKILRDFTSDFKKIWCSTNEVLLKRSAPLSSHAQSSAPSPQQPVLSTQSSALSSHLLTSGGGLEPVAGQADQHGKAGVRQGAAVVRADLGIVDDKGAAVGKIVRLAKTGGQQQQYHGHSSREKAGGGFDRSDLIF